MCGMRTTERRSARGIPLLRTISTSPDRASIHGSPELEGAGKLEFTLRVELIRHGRSVRYLPLMVKYFSAQVRWHAHDRLIATTRSAIAQSL
jgi:hypothetical protein